MKRKWRACSQYLPWLVLLLGVDTIGALLLWIADARVFCAMVLLLVLGTILLFAAVCGVLIHLEEKRCQAFFDFLHTPEDYQEKQLIHTLRRTDAEPVRILGETLRGQLAENREQQMQLADYEEYVESWVHEAKTALSLLSLVLDNHREELGTETGFKLDYVQNRLQESINQMLYYARLKGKRKDYFFESVSLRECLAEVLTDYAPLLEEKGFQVEWDVGEEEVYTDRRGLYFLLGQVIGNGVKYSGSLPKLSLSVNFLEKALCLSVKDNGNGVKSCDLPYLFEKGFTGDSGQDKKKATGMGLYLAKEMAKDLGLILEVHSKWQEGFEMQITFPVVK